MKDVALACLFHESRGASRKRMLLIFVAITGPRLAVGCQSGTLGLAAMLYYLWWAIKLCRFTPGELDPYVPGIRRLPAEERLWPAWPSP
jgi:hypothetical protein